MIVGSVGPRRQRLPGRRAGSLAAGLVAAVLLVGLTGCTGAGGRSGQPAERTSADGAVSQAATRPGGSAVDPSAPALAPAAEAGGACQMLDFAVIHRVVGTEFAIAAAGQQNSTYTCVVQPRGAGYPDLLLSVTATVADAQGFKTAMMPAGAAVVQQLGKAGYSAGTPASGTAGPGVEVGWLSGNNRLIVLRYRLDPAAPPEAATEYLPKLVELAKTIDYNNT